MNAPIHQQIAAEQRAARLAYPDLVRAAAEGNSLDRERLRETLAVLGLDSAHFQESVRLEQIRLRAEHSRRIAEEHAGHAGQIAAQKLAVQRRMAERLAEFEAVQREFLRGQEFDAEVMAGLTGREKHETQTAEVLLRQAADLEQAIAKNVG